MLFNSPIIRRQIDVVKYGAAQKQFNVSHAVNFLVVVPPLSEQVAILRGLEHDLHSIDFSLNQARDSISLLREYRTRLIADVVTGKLDVREVAVRLPEEPEQAVILDEADMLEGVAAGDGALEAVEVEAGP
jgi:type I restriction enzyme S subunit